MSTDFNFDIQDDLNVGQDYKEREFTARPPLPGNYRVQFTNQIGFQQKKTGELVLWKDSSGNAKYPVIEVKLLEIIDPFEYARKVGVFQQIPTAPYEREGALVSDAADVLRAVDVNRQASNTGEVIAALAEASGQQAQMNVRLDYMGYDKEFAAQEVERVKANGGDQKAINKAYRSAEVRGFKRIKADNIKRGRADLPVWKWVGPSGNVVDVKPYVSVFYASDDTVVMGPDKSVQPQQ